MTVAPDKAATAAAIRGPRCAKRTSLVGQLTRGGAWEAKPSQKSFPPPEWEGLGGGLTTMLKEFDSRFLAVISTGQNHVKAPCGCPRQLLGFNGRTGGYFIKVREHECGST